jgi:ABC-type antimicrobial peptide transport system permease subunit
VGQRTHEIGIRMALGAGRAAVLQMTLAEALRIGAIGLAIGIPAALALMHTMSSALYGVVRLDVPSLAASVAVLAFSALTAGWVPALRASRVDPVVALRQE